MMVKNFLIIGAGGAIGSMLRYSANLFIGSRPFPLATLIVNSIGSFIIGIVIALSIKNQTFDHNWKLFLTAGICGGFTTFSAFSLENLLLLQNGKYHFCIINIIGSLVLGILAAWLGFKLIN